MRSIVNTKILRVIRELAQQLEANRGSAANEQIDNIHQDHEAQSPWTIHGLIRTGSGDVCKANSLITTAVLETAVAL